MHNRLVRANAMKSHKFSPTDPEDLCIEELLNEAFTTSRLCAREGEQRISESNTKVDSECGHTACLMCTSNPRHRYLASVAREDRRQIPSDFVRALRTHLP